MVPAVRRRTSSHIDGSGTKTGFGEYRFSSATVKIPCGIERKNDPIEVRLSRSRAVRNRGTYSIGSEYALGDGQRDQSDRQEVRLAPKRDQSKRGDRIKLVITALDRDHGFKLEAFHIDRKLPKGEAVSVEVTADRTGTFPFECSHFCGLGHKGMKGHLTVE